MSAETDKIRAIGDTWAGAYEKAQATPDLWKPHWPYGELVLIDEMVGTLVTLAARERAPSGFGPGFQLSRVLVAAALPGLQSTASQLAGGAYNYLPTFVGQVQDALSKMHSVILFSEPDFREGTSADLSVRLAESIVLLETAQAELAEKKERLAEIENLAQAVETSAASSKDANERIAGAKETADETLGEIQTQKASIDKSAEAVSSAQEKIEETVSDAEKKIAKAIADNQEKLDGAIEATEAASAVATAAGRALTELLDKATAQNVIIDGILPRGASAGLAAAFSHRVAQLDLAKWIWMTVFSLSLAGLGLAAYTLTGELPTDPTKFFTELLWRLTRATPLVWLAWVSIVQYGNTIRVQEDYAFKEATSKAFQGYRDHMEHLRTVSDEEAGNALNLLTTRTIEILAREPLRIYDKTGKDASPAHSLLAELADRLKALKPGEKPGE